MNRTFKVVIVGNVGSGKTSYVKRLPGLYPLLGYRERPDVEPYGYRFNETYTFDLWDIDGSEKFDGLHDAVYVFANACIVFYDSKSNADTTIYWIKDVWRITGRIPTVIIANGVENVDQRKLDSDLVRIIKGLGIQSTGRIASDIRLYPISAKNDSNLFAPFSDLLQQLVV